MRDADAQLLTESDEQRTDRLVGWLMAIGGTVLLVGRTVPAIVHAPGGDHPTWWHLLGAVQVVLLLTLAVAGWVLPFALLRAGWLALPIGNAAVQLTAFAGYSGESAHTMVSWPQTLDAVGASTLLLWVSPWGAVVGVVIVTMLPLLSGLLFLGFVPDMAVELIPLHLTYVGFLAVFQGIRTQVLHARRSETAAMRERERERRVSAEVARQRQLSRIVHDHVLSVLTAALTLPGLPPAELQQAASRAVLLTRGPRDALLEEPWGSVTAHEFSRDLRRRLRAVDVRCRIEVDVDDSDLPMGAAAALSDASTEALRNSVRHAGSGATRTTTIVIRAGAVVVTVVDTGVGFDPDAVARERLGLRDSIISRMRSVGGSALVQSAPSEGTEVRLAWSA
ncbi:ATP-binding protein [Microbacterium sp.]|uniref:ATP-binding protein n=1 Tax=Microbacterium sp. TaxID=51671 RepID=UPI0039E564D2